jgi:hypothetical protein
MRVLDWRYEVPSAGGSAAGLEEYVVVGPGGDPLGKVLEVIQHRDERFLVVERGSPPVSHDPRVVPWNLLREIDHDALTVVLSTEDDLDDLPALDPSKGVEITASGAADLDAVRVTDLGDADQPRTVAPGNVSGPADRPTYAAALLIGALGIFTLLVGVIVVSLVGEWWALALFAVPALLLAAAGVLAYRAWRVPYERA